MRKTLHFSVSIASPKEHVWNTMLGPETYKAWTAPFCEGSCFEGSWEAGTRMRFLAPSGDGMVSVIAENRPHEYLSIRHIGEIRAGEEDTTSEKVRAWAGAYENYALRAAKGGTDVEVSVDVTAEFEKYMADTFPRALGELKAICEGRPVRSEA